MPLTRKKVARGSKAKAAARAKAEKTTVEEKKDDETADDVHDISQEEAVEEKKQETVDVQEESQEDKQDVDELDVANAKEAEENVDEDLGDVEGDVEDGVEDEGFLQGDGDEIMDEQYDGEEELADDNQIMETVEDRDEEVHEINCMDGGIKEEVTISISSETDVKMAEDAKSEEKVSATDIKTEETSLNDQTKDTINEDIKEDAKGQTNDDAKIKIEKIEELGSEINQANVETKSADNNVKQEEKIDKVDSVKCQDNGGKVEETEEEEKVKENDKEKKDDEKTKEDIVEKIDELENAEEGDEHDVEIIEDENTGDEPDVEMIEDDNVEEGADEQDKELDEDADLDEKDEHDDDDDHDHPDIDTSNLIDSLPQSDWDIINEMFKNPPFPESLSKLQKLTVTIGPIQQGDLLSLKLHEVLRMIQDFEITFQGKEKPAQRGRKVFEKLGYVKTQFKIKTPAYLVKMATLLGNLNIRGRDMSVKFPEVFNTAVKEAREYLNKNGPIIQKNKKDKTEYITNLKRRKIIVKNIPENTTEETMKALFPECLTVVFRADEDDKKDTCSAMLTFEDGKSCLECYDNSKDVEIGDSKVVMKLLYEPSKVKRVFRGSGRGGFRGRGGFGRGLGSSFRGMRSQQRGRGISASGMRGRGVTGVSPRRPPVATKPSTLADKERGQFDSNPRKRTFSGTSSKQETGKRSSQERRSAERQSLGSEMGPPKSKRPALKSPQRGGQFKDVSPKGKQGDTWFKRGRKSRFSREFPDRGSAMGRVMQQKVQHGNVGQFQQGNMQGGNMMRNNQFGQLQQQQQFQQQQNFQMQSQMQTQMSPLNSAMQRPSNQGMNQEDPMAMMMYLKDTIAKMEEKISQRSNEGPRGNQFGGMAGSSRDNFSDYSPPINRKRQGDVGGMMYDNQNVKRNRQNDFNMRGQGSGFQNMSQSNQGFQGGGNNFNNNRNRGKRFGGRGGGGNQGNRNNFNNQQSGGRYGGGNW